MALNPIDRRYVEAMKKSPYIYITFEFGFEETTLEMKDKLLAHDVAIAVQSFLNRKSEEK